MVLTVLSGLLPVCQGRGRVWAAGARWRVSTLCAVAAGGGGLLGGGWLAPQRPLLPPALGFSHQPSRAMALDASLGGGQGARGGLVL